MRHTPQDEGREIRPTMRPHNDQIAPPLPRLGQDLLRGIAHTDLPRGEPTRSVQLLLGPGQDLHRWTGVPKGLFNLAELLFKETLVVSEALIHLGDHVE